MKRVLIITLCLFQTGFFLAMDGEPEADKWFVRSRNLKLPVLNEKDEKKENFIMAGMDPHVEAMFDNLCSKRGQRIKGHPGALVDPEELLSLEQAVQLLRARDDLEQDSWQITRVPPSTRVSQEDAIQAEVDALWAQREPQNFFECTVRSMKPSNQRTSHTVRFGFLQGVPTIALLKVLERNVLVVERGSLKIVLRKTDVSDNQMRRLRRKFAKCRFTIHNQSREITAIKGWKPY